MTSRDYLTGATYGNAQWQPIDRRLSGPGADLTSAILTAFRPEQYGPRRSKLIQWIPDRCASSPTLAGTMGSLTGLDSG